MRKWFSREREYESEELPPLRIPIDQKSVLLHGLLHIRIIRANHVQNKDAAGKFLPKFIAKRMNKFFKDVSDPFVVVYAEKLRIAKTTFKLNTLNPYWNEDFTVNIAANVSNITFELRDEDQFGSDFLGDVKVSIHEFLKIEPGDEDYNSWKIVPSFLHRTSYICGKKRYGEFEYVIEYVPCEYLSKSLTVPNTYFSPTWNNHLDLYFNADDPPHLTHDRSLNWIPKRFWVDLYQALHEAKHFIYLTGWSINTKTVLIRDQNLAGYGETFGELLKRKADQGVRIILLLWNDPSSTNYSKAGLLQTFDEETISFFKHTNVICRSSGRKADLSNKSMETIAVQSLFTHHQKSIICDIQSPDNRHERALKAFLGGIDITLGRFDDSRYCLFRTINSIHLNDSANHCFAVNPKCGPREPWHDIHAGILGPICSDILENFTERFKKEFPDDWLDIISLKSVNIDPKKSYSNANGDWAIQLLRSIDSRSTLFDTERISTGFQDRLDHLTSQSEGDITAKQNVMIKKGRIIDDSIQKAYIHHIRNAEKFIYISNQYFLGSSYEWENHLDAQKATNQVAMEIALKICSKIKRKERFTAYIMIPLFPEGLPSANAIQEILFWQSSTIKMMYKMIADQIKSEHLDEAHPCDYLNFYCLGNRETEIESQSRIPPETQIEKLLDESRRMMIYIHSKMMIVDDKIIIVGSANINDRSLIGTRDTEIAISAFQLSDSAKEAVNNGDIQKFRLHIWKCHLGESSSLDKLIDPNSLECLRYINTRANQALDEFISERVVDMKCHWMKYPIKISKEGFVSEHPNCKYIPDSSKATILGSRAYWIPQLLTT
jgi:phospholipase D1/2